METKKKINAINTDLIPDEPINFAIKDITSYYFDYNSIVIHFDTYQSKNNCMEIDFYTFLHSFDTSVINMIKENLINLIKTK